jgi:hypothetical protein
MVERTDDDHPTGAGDDDRGAVDVPEAPWDGAGRGLVRLDWWATAALAGSTLVSAVFLGDIRYAGVAVALVLFALGCVTFLWAYGIAVQRSRVDAIAIGGLFFLAGTVAPRAVKRSLNAALAVQVAVSVAGASVRPFTTLAFGTLAPMVGLGLNGLWAARHGRFPPRGSSAARDRSGPVEGGHGGRERRR